MTGLLNSDNGWCKHYIAGIRTEVGRMQCYIDWCNPVMTYSYPICYAHLQVFWIICIHPIQYSHNKLNFNVFHTVCYEIRIRRIAPSEYSDNMTPHHYWTFSTPPPLSAVNTHNRPSLSTTFVNQLWHLVCKWQQLTSYSHINAAEFSTQTFNH